jgi:PTS system mannose-specific IIC component
MLFYQQILLLSAAAGLLGMDATAALQIMVSRPLVAGGVAGLLLGDSGTGLAAGSLVELLWMGGVPVGSLVPPDGTLAAFFAASAAVLLPRWMPDASQLSYVAAGSLGLLAAVPVAALGAKAEIFQRMLTDRLARRAEASVAQGRTRGIALALLGGLVLAFSRSFIMTALMVGLGVPALALLYGHLPSHALIALRWGYWLAWLLGLAVAADYFWERRSLKYLGLSAVALAAAGSRPEVSQVQLLALALGLAFLGGWWRWRRSQDESHQEAL